MHSPRAGASRKPCWRAKSPAALLVGNSMAQLALRGLTKRFGAVEAVRGVDLEVAHEEFVVLVGPSGCGKSTILRMIAGLEEASAGEIRIGDRLVNNTAPKDRNIAMVFQNYALYPHKTVYGNMAFALRAQRLPKADVDRRVQQAAAILGLETLMDRKPGELSGGQRQRVAMGRAIVRDPAVFLFDEPLSNLDAELRSRLRSEIKKLHQKLRATVVYVTHDQVEAMTLADRIVILNNGKVEQVGSPTEVYATPANLFVAGFIGSPAMNLLPAEIASDANGLPCILAAETCLPLDPRTAIASTLGVKATFGIRPEDIAVLPPGAHAPAAIEARVVMVEPLGAEYLLSFAFNGHEIMAKIAGRALPKVGESLRFAFNMDHSHIFDAATGRTLRR
jgi:multiple sugar transport system ATP-binding protein